MDKDALAEESDETVDEILGGRLRIIQKKQDTAFPSTPSSWPILSACGRGMI